MFCLMLTFLMYTRATIFKATFGARQQAFGPPSESRLSTLTLKVRAKRRDAGNRGASASQSKQFSAIAQLTLSMSSQQARQPLVEC